MRIAYDEAALGRILEEALVAFPGRPVLIDRFLEDAFELDVDALGDGTEIVIAGVMQHIEEAGIHSGDSACVIPPYTLGEDMIRTIRESTILLARELEVVGLMNIQYAVKNDILYVLEVNPRASRTVPFVSKATGIPWAKIEAKIMVGRKLSELGVRDDYELNYIALKESVFPFSRFHGQDMLLSPEMRSTGEVMGLDPDLGIAYACTCVSPSSGAPTAAW